jgi:hypothetical protein
MTQHAAAQHLKGVEAHEVSYEALMITTTPITYPPLTRNPSIERVLSVNAPGAAQSLVHSVRSPLVT